MAAQLESMDHYVRSALTSAGGVGSLSPDDLVLNMPDYTIHPSRVRSIVGLPANRTRIGDAEAHVEAARDVLEKLAKEKAKKGEVPPTKVRLGREKRARPKSPALARRATWNSTKRRLVELVGIEPTTSSMPWKRSPS